MKRKKMFIKTGEDVLELMEKEIQHRKREGPILASRPDTDRILILPFVTPGGNDYTPNVLRGFVSVLRQMRFCGFCHCFDQSLPRAYHDVVGIAFSHEREGTPCDKFEEIWPLLINQFSLQSEVKILPEETEFRTLGYVRTKMLNSGTVLFQEGLPCLAFSHQPFAAICYEEFLRSGAKASGHFFQDPLEHWGPLSLGPLPETDDPDNIPY